MYHSALHSTASVKLPPQEHLCVYPVSVRPFRHHVFWGAFPAPQDWSHALLASLYQCVVLSSPPLAQCSLKAGPMFRAHPALSAEEAVVKNCRLNEQQPSGPKLLEDSAFPQHGQTGLRPRGLRVRLSRDRHSRPSYSVPHDFAQITHLEFSTSIYCRVVDSVSTQCARKHGRKKRSQVIATAERAGGVSGQAQEGDGCGFSLETSGYLLHRPHKFYQSPAWSLSPISSQAFSSTLPQQQV